MFLGVRLNWAVWLSQGTQYLLMKMSPTRKMLKTKGIEIVKWTAVVFFTLQSNQTGSRNKNKAVLLTQTGL